MGNMICFIPSYPNTCAPEDVFVSSSRVENLIAGQYQWVVSFSKAVPDLSLIHI